MKTVIKIFVISLILINASKAQEELIIAKGKFDKLSVKGVSFEKLYMVDKDFTSLKDLGKPIKVDSSYMTAEPKWVFYYPDFTLTFVQFFPSGPELMQVEVTNEEAQFNYLSENLFNQNQEALRSRSVNFQFQSVSPQKSDYEKFGDEHQILEYHYFLGKLKRVVYKIDPQL